MTDYTFEDGRSLYRVQVYGEVKHKEIKNRIWVYADCRSDVRDYFERKVGVDSAHVNDAYYEAQEWGFVVGGRGGSEPFAITDPVELPADKEKQLNGVE
jgi:hypothetical protein